MRSNYKMHFRVMAPVLLPYFCVLLVGFILWDYVYVACLKPIQKEFGSIENIQYANVIESESPEAPYLKMKKLNNLITFSSDGSKKQNINTYISDNHKEFCSSVLGLHEIAISAKMANKLKVGIGDKVYAEYPIYVSKFEYTVKEILPYGSDMYNLLDNQDFSYAIVGDDGTLLSNAQGKYVYYLQQEQYDEYMDKELSYSGHFSIRDDKNQIKSKELYVGLALAGFLLMFVTIILLLAQKAIMQEVLKYYYDGFDIRAVKRIDRTDHFMFCGLPIAIEIIWLMLKMSTEGEFLLAKIGIISALSLLLVVDILLGGHKFGKAN